MSLVDYVRLFRFYSHTSFLVVVAAAIFFSKGVSLNLMKSLIMLYLSFNVLLYGGLYTLNSIADLDSDKRHSLKKNRPLPAGKISVTSASIFAVTLVILGLASGFLLFGVSVFYLYILFILLNLLYTFALKHIPYIELVANSITHPLRLVLALMIFNNANIPSLLVLGYFFTILGSACVRRIVEKDVKGWEARSVLRHYSTQKLLYIQIASFAFLLLTFFYEYKKYAPLYAIMVMFYIALVFGNYFSSQVRAHWTAVFTR